MTWRRLPSKATVGAKPGVALARKGSLAHPSHTRKGVHQTQKATSQKGTSTLVKGTLSTLAQGEGCSKTAEGA